MTAAVLAPRSRRGEVIRRLHEVSPSEDLDLVLEHISPGEVLFSTHARRMGQHPGVITHGGVCTTLLDFALSSAVQSLLAPGRSYRPVDFAVTLGGVSRPLEGRLEATAHAVRRGSGILVASGSVRGGDGVLHATGRLVALATEGAEA